MLRNVIHISHCIHRNSKRDPSSDNIYKFWRLFHGILNVAAVLTIKCGFGTLQIKPCSIIRIKECEECRLWIEYMQKYLFIKTLNNRLKASWLIFRGILFPKLHWNKPLKFLTSTELRFPTTWNIIQIIHWSLLMDLTNDSRGWTNENLTSWGVIN